MTLRINRSKKRRRNALKICHKNRTAQNSRFARCTHRYHLNCRSDYVFCSSKCFLYYFVELPQLSCNRRTSIIIKPPQFHFGFFLHYYTSKYHKCIFCFFFGMSHFLRQNSRCVRLVIVFVCQAQTK